MCGIVGYSGQENYSDSKIALLLLYNSLKRNSEDATGIWSPINTLKKDNISCSTFLKSTQISPDKVFIGHLRAKSIGANTKENAHPYQFDNIIGCQNGTLNNHWNIARSHKLDLEPLNVDGEIIMKVLSKTGDLKVLNQISGPTAFLWYNTTTGYLYAFRNSGRPLYRGYIGKSMYISSEADALKIIGCKNTLEFKEEFLYVMKDGGFVGNVVKLKNNPISCDHNTKVEYKATEMYAKTSAYSRNLIPYKNTNIRLNNKFRDHYDQEFDFSNLTGREYFHNEDEDQESIKGAFSIDKVCKYLPSEINSRNWTGVNPAIYQGCMIRYTGENKYKLVDNDNKCVLYKNSWYRISFLSAISVAEIYMRLISELPEITIEVSKFLCDFESIDAKSKYLKVCINYQWDPIVYPEKDDTEYTIEAEDIVQVIKLYPNRKSVLVKSTRSDTEEEILLCHCVPATINEFTVFANSIYESLLEDEDDDMENQLKEVITTVAENISWLKDAVETDNMNEVRKALSEFEENVSEFYLLLDDEDQSVKNEVVINAESNIQNN